jgi:hypothetical protein
MTNYRPSLWDDSDPLYAPGLDCKSRGRIFWRAPKKYVEAGYKPAQIPLEPGERHDGHEVARAAKCRQYTREVLHWWEGETDSRETVGWVIRRYLCDVGSTYRRVKANTAASYRHDLNYWAEAIGDLMVADLDYTRLSEIERGMKGNGRSTAFIHRKFTLLRLVVRYGVLLEATGAERAQRMLSNMTFATPPRRSVAPSRNQVYAVAAQAWKAGHKGFALAACLQYEFALRLVDVAGQWLDTDGKSGGIVNNGQMWVDGLTWDMVEPGCVAFSKVISKTAKSLPETIRFPLDHLPKLRRRLLALSPKVGPVILDPHGRPYVAGVLPHMWRKFARAAGVPDDVQMRDIRAGAITEANGMGAQREMLSQAAQHTQITTTARYVRDRDNSVAKVVALRQKGK